MNNTKEYWLELQKKYIESAHTRHQATIKELNRQRDSYLQDAKSANSDDSRNANLKYADEIVKKRIPDANNELKRELAYIDKQTALKIKALVK